MKFLVGDKQTDRHAIIKSYLDEKQAVIAVILAAIDLEWTIRRTIDAATADGIRLLPEKKISGLDRYADEWRLNCKQMMPLEKLIPDWEKFKELYQIRHDIVHGRAGTTGRKFAGTRVEAILRASQLVAEEGENNGAHPFKRLKKRRLAKPTP